MVVASVDVVPRCAHRTAARAPIAYIAAKVVLRDLVSPALIPPIALSNLRSWSTLGAPLPLPLPRLPTLPTLPRLLSLFLSRLPWARLTAQRILSTPRQRLDLI